MLKSLIVGCLLGSVVMLHGDELNEFRKTIFPKYEQTYKLYDNANTQRELTAVAGTQKQIVEKLFQETFEWSLANAKNEQERKKVFAEFYDIVYDIGFSMAKASQNIDGSSAAMRFYSEEASMMMMAIEKILMSKEEKELWEAVNFAYGKVGENEITLNKGKCYFKANRYDEEYELLAECKNPFIYKGKIFAIIIIDLPGSVNSDFLEQYLYKIEDNQLNKIEKLDTFYLHNSKFKNGKLYLYGEKTHSQGKYQKVIDINL